MRITGLITLVLLILAGHSLVNPATENPPGQCAGQWIGTITYTIVKRKKGSSENKLVYHYWNEEAFYETKSQLDGSRNEHGAPIAIVKAVANESKEWGGRGKGVCYRETNHNQAVSGSENKNTHGFYVTFNPRTREYLVSAPVLMVLASGQYVVSSRVKGTCNNPYNKNFSQVDEIERYELSDDAPTLIGTGVIDPSKPNHLVGSESAEHNDRNGLQKTVTIKWDLRCSGQ